MTNSEIIISIQTKANQCLLDYNKQMDEVQKAHYLGRAAGLIASLKYIADEATYKSIATTFFELALKRADEEGTKLK